jgi:hypothetical protein
VNWPTLCRCCLPCCRHLGTLLRHCIPGSCCVRQHNARRLRPQLGHELYREQAAISGPYLHRCKAGTWTRSQSTKGRAQGRGQVGSVCMYSLYRHVSTLGLAVFCLHAYSCLAPNVKAHLPPSLADLRKCERIGALMHCGILCSCSPAAYWMPAQDLSMQACTTQFM